MTNLSVSPFLVGVSSRFSQLAQPSALMRDAEAEIAKRVEAREHARQAPRLEGGVDP
jgi:hypothetical protein